MATKKRQTVDSWAESVIGEVINGKACSAITCLHLKGVGGATEEVVTKPLEGTISHTDLANFLIGRAEGFSQDLGGLQTFKLLAFYGDNEPHNPFHFTTSDGSIISRSETVMSAHEPTPTGLLGQLMKHNENIIGQNDQLVRENMAVANGVISMCFGPNGIVQQSIKAQLEAVEVVKDAMLDMGRERKALIIEESKAAQDLLMRKSVMEMVPQLANRITGREIFDEKTNDSKIMEKLALKVTPEHIQMLVGMNMLSQEEALILSARFATIVKEKEEESKALQHAPPEDSASKALATTKGNDGLS